MISTTPSAYRQMIRRSPVTLELYTFTPGRLTLCVRNEGDAGFWDSSVKLRSNCLVSAALWWTSFLNLRVKRGWGRSVKAKALGVAGLERRHQLGHTHGFRVVFSYGLVRFGDRLQQRHPLSFGQLEQR